MINLPNNKNFKLRFRKYTLKVNVTKIIKMSRFIRFRNLKALADRRRICR